MKSKAPRPVLSLKKALLKSSSTRSMDATANDFADGEYMVEIVPNLFIADYNTVSAGVSLALTGIDVVINLVSHKCPNAPSTYLKYENYALCDTTTQDLLSVVEDVLSKIDEHLQSGRKVVVHCCKGISRAPSIVMAYLITRERLQLECAFELVKRKSPRVEPNAGFLMQLNTLACLANF